MKLKVSGGYWVRSGAFTMLRNLSGMLLSIAGFYFLVRLLNKADFGVWTLFLSTTTLLEIARNGLVCNGLIKFLAGSSEEDYPKIVTAAAALMVGLTILCAGLLLGLAPYLSRLWEAPRLVPMFSLYLIVFFCTGAINHFGSVQQAALKFNGIFYSSLAGSLMNFGYILLCWLGVMKVSLIGLLWVQIGATAVALIIATVATRPLLKVSRTLDRGWVRSLFSFGKFSFGTVVSAMVFSSIDGWMLGALIAPAAAGAYSIATRITNLVEVPTGTVATIVFPQSAKRMESGGKEAVKYLYEKSVGTILALLIPGLLFLYFFSGIAVNVLAGEKYADAIPILQVTLLYAILIPYGRQFGTIMDSIGKPDVNFKLVVAAAALNVGLNFLFIPRFGVLGAAYATLSANAVAFLVAQIILKKQLDVRLYNTLLYAIRFYPEMFNKYLRFRKTAKSVPIGPEL